MQLVELQKVYGALREQGVSLFGVSYDSVQSLARFAGQYGIEYPLLADTQSAVSASLGILNEAPEEDYMRGVPYPGVFVLAEDGTIAGKRFFETYRERETAVGLLEQALGIAAPGRRPEAMGGAGAVSVTVRLDSPTYVYMQRHYLSVELEIAAGYHVYGHPIPEGFVPLSVNVGRVEGLIAGSPTLPPTRPFRVEGLLEQFHVYEGSIRVAVPVTFGMRTKAGPQRVPVSVTFQACTARDCLPPARVDVEFLVEPLDPAEEAAHGFAPR